MVSVELTDGRIVRFTADDFLRLRMASLDHLRAVRLIADGVGLRWERLDEDLEVSHLLERYGVERRDTGSP